MIRLRTLGECIIEVDGEHYTPDSDQLFAALVYLTTERGRHLPRQALAELLWPHHDATRGRHCLRQLLYRLRIGGAPVEGGRETLMLPESLVAPTFSAAPAAERLVAERMAGTLTIGPVLPGYEPHFSGRFAEWLDKARAAMEARVRRVLLEVAHAHRLRGEWGEVDALARDVLLLDPLNEEATLARAEATAMEGAKNEAIEILDRFVAELGPERSQLHLPATVLRRRIAERFPSRRYGGPSERCFVGRAAIMQTLSTAMLRARNGEGSGVLLTGAPGIGKTRLVHELTKVASMQGVRVVRATTVESDAERPLSAFSEAVPQLRALPGAIGVAPDSLAFLDRLTEVHPAGGVQPDDISDPRWIASRIRQSIVDLCDAVTGEATVLLVIEDVHWLDASSWAVIASLLEWLPKKRLLMLLTSRGPHPTPVTPQRCVEQLAVHPVLALTPEAASAYAREIVKDHGGSLGEDALAWCVSVGEGNPLFLRELVVHRLEGGAEGTMPPSLQGLLDARLARLSPTARRVLESASILGEFAMMEHLRTVLELPSHAFAGALDELTAALLLDDESTVVAPRHELIRRRVLDTTSRAVRRLLHGRAAACLSDTKSQHPTAERLLAAATHWRAAQEADRAVDTLMDAAGAVERLGAIPDSIRLLEGALEFDPSESKRTSILRRTLRCLSLSASWERAKLVGAELATLRAATLDPEASAGDALLRINAEFRSGADTLPLLDELYAVAADPQFSPGTRVQAARLGLVLATNSGRGEATARFWEVTADARTSPTLDPLERLNLEMIFEADHGDPRKALEHAEALRILAAEESDPLKRLGALQNVAQAYVLVGMGTQAVPYLEAALRAAREAGSVHFEVLAVHTLFEVHLLERDKSRAQYWLECFQQRISTFPQHVYRTPLLESNARLALLEGRCDRAFRAAFELYESVRSEPFPLLWILSGAITTLVEVLLNCSDETVDPALIRELERVHVSLRSQPMQDRTAAVLALALERSGRADDAARIIGDYVREFRRSLAAWTSPASLIRG